MRRAARAAVAPAAPVFPVVTHQGAGTAIAEYVVFGERNSGTNFIGKLLQLNLAGLSAGLEGGGKVNRWSRYGWKHGFPQMVSAPDHCLAVVAFRHPERWLQSLHRKPWHTAPRRKWKGMQFSDFIRTPWRAAIDAEGFGVARDDPRWNTELQWERHPLTGDRFANVIQLRNAKNQGFLSFPKRFRNTVLVRYEDVAAEPEAFVTFLAEQYGVARRDDFTPVEGRRGKSTPFTPKSYDPISPEDRDFIWQELDAGLEAQLGYAPRADA